MELAAVVNAICVCCKNIKDCIEIKRIRKMCFLGTWRYHWLFDDWKRNMVVLRKSNIEKKLEYLQICIDYIEEKPFKCRLGNADDESIQQLCLFLDSFYSTFQNADSGDYQQEISLIYDFICHLQECPPFSQDSKLWELGQKLLRMTRLNVKKHMVEYMNRFAEAICRNARESSGQLDFAVQIIHLSYSYYLVLRFQPVNREIVQNAVIILQQQHQNPLIRHTQLTNDDYSRLLSLMETYDNFYGMNNNNI